jgi:hypothetical protein
MWPVNWASYLSRRAGNHEGRVQCPSLCHARLAPCARQAEDDPASLFRGQRVQLSLPRVGSSRRSRSKQLYVPDCLVVLYYYLPVLVRSTPLTRRDTAHHIAINAESTPAPINFWCNNKF